jgi:hypothetical protein
MARSTIFGYTAEEEDGKLIITLTGSVAETLLDKYSVEAIGQNPNLVSSLLPFASLSSRPVLLRSNLPSRKAEGLGKLDIKEIFGQGFDRNKSEFDAQLDEYRNLLSAMAPKGSTRSAERGAPKRSSKRAARKKQTNRAGAKPKAEPLSG